ncbi:site-specific integrase [Clostridia bacterium]|nr:site-specific integrase [Clostridia bacterium]
MTGSLHVKNEHFYMVLNTYENGKRKQKWIATGLIEKGNKTRAKVMLAKTLSEYTENKQIDTPTSATLFSTYLVHWLKTTEKTVDPVTYYGYEDTAKAQVIPYFERTKIMLENMDRKALQSYFDDKAKQGRLDGNGGLSARSLQRHKTVINCALNLAVDEELINANPCVNIKLPKIQPLNYSWFNTEQFNRFLGEIRDEPLYPVVLFSGFYGLRKSEVLGLKWDAVDFGNNTFRIQHTVVDSHGHTVIKDKTKNISSNRELPISDKMRAVLVELKAKEDANRKLYGNIYNENDYVFKQDNGVPFSPQFVTNKFAWLLDYCGFPHIRFHDLRHSCASQMLSDGFSIFDISKWLGHATPTVTQNVYSHLDNSRKKEIANARLRSQK